MGAADSGRLALSEFGLVGRQSTLARHREREPFLEEPRIGVDVLRSAVPMPSYAYAAGNPVVLVDPDGNLVAPPPPLGLGPVVVAGGAAFAAGAAIGYGLCRLSGNAYCDPRTWFPRSPPSPPPP